MDTFIDLAVSVYAFVASVVMWLWVLPVFWQCVIGFFLLVMLVDLPKRGKRDATEQPSSQKQSLFRPVMGSLAVGAILVSIFGDEEATACCDMPLPLDDLDALPEIDLPEQLFDHT